MMASEWQPIASGFHWDSPHLTFVHIKEDLLRTGNDYDPGCEVQLADGVRLCRLVPAAPAVPPDIAAAIGYCWRWAQTHAEKCIDSEERYQFMCGEIDKVVLWLESQPAAQDTQGEGDGSPR